MTPKNIGDYIQQKIEERKTKNALRTLSVENGLVDFCSNDYLGFARDLDLAEKTHQDLMSTPESINGSTGARTITGTSSLTIHVEGLLAKYHKAESALFYNSGYSANLGLFSALPYRGDTILYDELIHASIRDGIALGRANAWSFKHNNLEHLEKRLQLAKGKIYVAVEAIYSMDGDAAPLRKIADLCKKYQAAFIVDEAHSNGLYGEKGEGMVCELGLEKEVFCRVMTFGKAIGSHGAVIVGSQNLKDFLINYSRPFIYTTAPSKHQLLSVKNAYDKLSLYGFKKLKISCLRDLFKLKIQSNFSFQLIESNSPIQCVIIPGNDRVKQVCLEVQNAGFDVRPIVAPTVPEGKERIRICFHEFNTEEEVLGLVDAIKKALSKIENI